MAGTIRDSRLAVGRGRRSRPQDERNAPPSVVVIFGASGDLTRRKLVPALESLARAKRLPPQFAVVGVARTPMSDDDFRRPRCSATAASR